MGFICFFDGLNRSTGAYRFYETSILRRDFKGWRQTRLGWEGNFRQRGSVEEGTRERTGETDVCSWSQIDEAKVKGWEQSSLRRHSILLLPLPLQA